jgi:hypothetical protein
MGDTLFSAGLMGEGVVTSAPCERCNRQVSLYVPFRVTKDAPFDETAQAEAIDEATESCGCDHPPCICHRSFHPFTDPDRWNPRCLAHRTQECFDG